MERQTFLSKAREAIRDRQEIKRLVALSYKSTAILLGQCSEIQNPLTKQPYVTLETTIVKEGEPPVKVFITSRATDPLEYIRIGFESLDEAIHIQEHGVGEVYDYSSYNHPKYLRKINLAEAQELCRIIDSAFREHRASRSDNGPAVEELALLVQ